MFFFFTLTNSAYPDGMPHGGISPVYKCKKHVPKNILKCSQISILKIFFVPNAYSGCNLRVGKFDVSASKMIIFIKAQENGQWKRIKCSQLL